MSALYLTSGERTIFEALSDAVRDGWQVEAETGTFSDSAEKMRTRLALLRLHDPTLTALRDKASSAESVDALAAMIQEMDLSGVSEGDLAELFFALGPTALSKIIADLLKFAKSDKDIDSIQSLTFIRHELIVSMT